MFILKSEIPLSSRPSSRPKPRITRDDVTSRGAPMGELSMERFTRREISISEAWCVHPWYSLGLKLEKPVDKYGFKGIWSCRSGGISTISWDMWIAHQVLWIAGTEVGKLTFNWNRWIIYPVWYTKIVWTYNLKRAGVPFIPATNMENCRFIGKPRMGCNSNIPNKSGSSPCKNQSTVIFLMFQLGSPQEEHPEMAITSPQISWPCQKLGVGRWFSASNW